MAYTTIDDPEAYFQNVLYTGDGSVDQDITFGGTNDMQPDLVWQATRNTTSERNVYDSVRGVKKRLHSEDSEAETTRNGVISFDSDGFSVGDHSGSNTNTNTYANWCWKAGGSTASNTTGDITTTVSVDTTAKFSIFTYTGSNVDGDTIGHSIGSVPHFWIIKRRSAAADWAVYHHKNTAAPETDYLLLSTTGATVDSTWWSDTAPTSTLITLGNPAAVNQGSSDTFVGYAWSEVQGFSKFGSYTGNGNIDSPFIYLGFRPALVIIKKSSGAGDGWMMFDNKREGFNSADGAAIGNNWLPADNTTAESSNNLVDFLSNGFKVRSTHGGLNDSTSSIHLFMAFAEAPFVNSNGVPCNAR